MIERIDCDMLKSACDCWHGYEADIAWATTWPCMVGPIRLANRRGYRIHFELAHQIALKQGCFSPHVSRADYNIRHTCVRIVSGAAWHLARGSAPNVDRHNVSCELYQTVVPCRPRSALKSVPNVDRHNASCELYQTVAPCRPRSALNSRAKHQQVRAASD